MRPVFKTPFLRLEMKKENAVMDIAGLLLEVKNHDGIFQQPTYQAFLAKGKKSHQATWRLNAVASKYPARNTPFFLSRPLRLNPRKKEITYFYPKKRRYACPPILDGKLLSYVYSQILALNKGALLHAAAVVKDRKAFLFFGQAGAGKSTVAGISRKHQVLGDDIIAVRKKDGHYYAFSTPWAQQPFIKPTSSQKCKVAAIFFINKSARVSFQSLESAEALFKLLSRHIHFLTYTQKPLLGAIFFTLSDFTRHLPAYEMEFVKARDFWRKLEEKTNAAKA